MKQKEKYLRKSYTMTDFYDSYRLYIELGTLYDVDLTTYKAILMDYFKYLRDSIILECKEVKLPCRLGTIQIIKHQPKEFTGKSLRWDWKATRETGKPVYLLNEHSDYYKYRFHWSKKGCLLTNKGKYLFIASRQNKRDLASIIINNLKDYPEL